MKTITKQTLRIFAQHVRPYRLIFFVMVLALGVSVIMEILIPVYYKKFFDALSSGTHGNAILVNQLTRFIIMILVLNGISWAMFRLLMYIDAYFQPKVVQNLTNTCFMYLHGHSYNFFINRFVGSLVRKVNRLVRAFENVEDQIFWRLYPLFLRIAAILVVIIYNHIALGVFLFIWLGVFLGTNYAFAVFRLRYDEEEATIDSTVTAQLADTISNNANIKVFTALPSEYQWFQKLTQKQFNIRKFIWNITSYMDAIQGALMILLEFGIFYVAVRLWNKGILTLGTLVLIQAYILQIFSHSWTFGRVIKDLYKSLADAEEMVEILNTPHEIRDKVGAKNLMVQNGLIEYRSVQFTYTKTRPVIKNLSLKISPGEKIGLVGPSGGGKSTLLALLFRFYDMQEGSIAIDGQNIADVTQESLRKNIALVPQDPILFHRTLRENIRYGRLDADDNEVIRASKLAHCDEFIEKLHDRYNTYVGERGIKLSGGERQRVAIARAILKNAPILVLDEATSSLDSHSEKLIQDALNKLMENKTVIVIAHRLSTIMKMDRIVVIKNGTIAEMGSHQELLKKKLGLYQKLWKLQAGGFIM